MRKELGIFLLLIALCVVTAAINLRLRLGAISGGLWQRLVSQPRGYYGMLLAHCGVAVFIIGVTLVKGYETEVWKIKRRLVEALFPETPYIVKK
jgi:cytochrome c-type biogenesis protein CcmF